jgi:hypothetical protein
MRGEWDKARAVGELINVMTIRKNSLEKLITNGHRRNRSIIRTEEISDHSLKSLSFTRM